MAKKLFYEIYKNIKIIFRSWSSVSLLILGPLLLILIIGFAFSGEKVHDIKIGVHSKNYETINDMLKNISSIGEVKKYKTINDCMKDMAVEKAHICLEISEDFIKKKENLTEIPTGEITFYYDNTRKKITNVVLDEIKKYLGITSQKISVESAKTIFDNIQSLVVFLQDRKSDVVEVKKQSEQIKNDLIMRKERLIEVREKFLPKYNKVKELQEKINTRIAYVNSSYIVLSGYMGESKVLINEINDELAVFMSMMNLSADAYVVDLNSTYSVFFNKTPDNFTAYSITDFKIYNIGNKTAYYLASKNLSKITLDTSKYTATEKINIVSILLLSNLKNLNESIDDLRYNIDDTYQNIVKLNYEFNSIIIELDEIKTILDEEITNTDEYIKKIDEGVKRIDYLTSEMDAGLSKISNLNPALAEKLINPISQNIESLIPEIKNIRLVFPVLLVVVIIFISMLFSNIVTLSEIHGRAYFRNLIAPVNQFIYTSGLLLTNFIVVLFQIIILFIVAQTRFEIDILSRFGSFLFISIVLIIIFILAGMILSYLFKNIQTSILTTTFFALLFFLFSDVVTPLETMPVLASFVAALNPMVIGEGIVKKILLFNLPLGSMLGGILILMLYIVVLFVVLIFVSKRRKK